MKRRALILILALVLMLSMVPVTAFAANDREASDSCISLIKYFEGFSKKPYWDYSQYTVGYGTRCPDDKLDQYMTYGITKAEAEALLTKELASFVKSVNNYDKANNLNLTQYEFDALVSFTYNVGAGWMSSSGSAQIQDAVLNNRTGNDFLYAMTQWSVAGGSTSLGLVNRRLVEANLYLNGVYSTVVPSNYTYVQFNHTTCTYQGKDVSVRIQGFDSALTDQVRPQGKKDGYRFLGWYTAADGGEWVSTLTSAVAGKTLYAHWQQENGNVASDGSILGTAAAYDRIASENLNIYVQPNTGAAGAGTIEAGTSMTIVADYVDANGVKWGNLLDGGWICLSGTGSNTGSSQPGGSEKEPVIATGNVKLSSGVLNIRAGAGTSYNKVGTLANGAWVEIYEIKTVSGTDWGRIAEGWISLDYVTMNKIETTEPEPTVPETTVPETTVPETTVPETTVPETTVPETTVPETTVPETTVPETTVPETTVPETTVPETTVPETTAPAPTAPPATEPPKQTPTVVATGTVKLSSGVLNVRAGAGTSYDKVGTLANGAKVQIYEIKTVSGTKWGKISSGWISMTYVNLDSTATETSKTLTGTVTASSLNVRAGAGTGYSIVGSYQNGAKVTIRETTKVGSVTWGRTDKGWVSMDYIKLDSGSSSTQTKPTESATTAPTTAAAGRAGTTTTEVNVRVGAGTNNTRVTRLAKGTKVTVTDMKMVNGTVWGKISNGWLCLDYVKLNAPTAGCPAIVTASTLNIRSGAGTSNSLQGSYVRGTLVTILETKTVGSVTWGRTAKGWISLDYVR